MILVDPWIFTRQMKNSYIHKPSLCSPSSGGKTRSCHSHRIQTGQWSKKHMEVSECLLLQKLMAIEKTIILKGHKLRQQTKSKQTTPPLNHSFYSSLLVLDTATRQHRSQLCGFFLAVVHNLPSLASTKDTLADGAGLWGRFPKP